MKAKFKKRTAISVCCQVFLLGAICVVASQEATAQSPGQYFLRSTLYPGRCIDVDGQPGTSNGLKLQLFDCETSGRSRNGQLTDQKWYFDNGFIKNALYPNRCIDVDGQPGTSNGLKLQLFDCETSGRSRNGQLTDQRWSFEDNYIRNRQSNRCIDVDGQPGTSNGLKLQLFDCETSGKSRNGQPTDQRWRQVNF